MTSRRPPPRAFWLERKGALPINLLVNVFPRMVLLLESVVLPLWATLVPLKRVTNSVTILPTVGRSRTDARPADSTNASPMASMQMMRGIPLMARLSGGAGHRVKKCIARKTINNDDA